MEDPACGSLEWAHPACAGGAFDSPVGDDGTPGDNAAEGGVRRRSSSGDGAQHRRLAQSPRHTRRDIGLATAARTQVVADYRRAQTVKVGNHDATLDPSRHLVDESGQARIVA